MYSNYLTLICVLLSYLVCVLDHGSVPTVRCCGTWASLQNMFKI